MPAPKENNNASKESLGIQVNFYLNAEDTEAIKKKLRQKGIEPNKKAVRKFAREQSKNGIWQSIRDELSPIIL